MNLPIELLQRAAVPVAQAFVAGLWQGIALALVTGLALRFLPGTSASARFAVWTAVLCVSAAMPVVHLFTSQSAPAATGSVLLHPRWSYLLASIWFGASLLRLMKLAVEALSLRKLWREAEPLTTELLEAAGLETDLFSRIHPLSNRHPERSLARPSRQTESKDPEGVRATETARTFRSSKLTGVHVCTTSDVDRPSVIGFFAPKILIPDWLFAQLSPTEFRHVVLHEMEHLRRRDDWLNLLQKIGLALFPLNPAMFWIDRRLSTEREIACDDGVLARTNTPRAYAASLTSVAERRLKLGGGRRMVALALGIYGTGKLRARRSEFARRIESILGQRAASRPTIATLLVVAIFGGSAAISHTPELISFGNTPRQVAAAVAAPVNTVANSAGGHRNPAPRFVNANLRLPGTQENRAARTFPKSVIHESKSVASISLSTKTEAFDQQRTPERGHSPRPSAPEWLVLTAYQESGNRSSERAHREKTSASDDDGGDVVVPVSRVVLRTPDGRFFATPYAAVPTQAGWLIVQL